MLALFRTNQLQLGIIMVVYALVIYAYGFYHPMDWAPKHPGVLVRWVYEQIGGTSGMGARMLAMLLVFLEAFVLNFIVARHRLGDEVNLFPGIFFILFSSLIPEFQQLSPLHFANFFLLLGLGECLKIYRAPECTGNLFNAGIWIGMASLCYSTYLLFLFFGLAAMITLRAVNLKEVLAHLIGGILPVIWAWIYGYYTDSLAFILERWRGDWGIIFLQLQKMTTHTIFLSALLALLVLIFLLSRRRYLLKTIFEVQKKINLLYWLLLTTSLTVIFQDSAGPQHFLVLALPAGIFLSFTFNSFSRQTAEVLHLLVFAGVLALQVVFAG
ncbi:MAG: hypothetical protein KDD12_15030 [Lewinella sp.]|nr:hypothetical protein [Lewinella sp.]